MLRNRSERSTDRKRPRLGSSAGGGGSGLGADSSSASNKAHTRKSSTPAPASARAPEGSGVASQARVTSGDRAAPQSALAFQKGDLSLGKRSKSAHKSTA
eukprot:CAMPEP_0181264782 /NCGR_PEP_ID=MMETSP1097-20121128/3346_1 /TAXON_ID=35684 /ORGANISM="Pseudopedinella elastica, Strain CCMP716" /LENGTH=99 /DNA_ID=CAMNT_0023363757 /DNA_START=861 /DNA_END=1161 /DNA_ORIENTATION=+